MNRNCAAGLYANSLSSHASLLLQQATPTIISSPLRAPAAATAAAEPGANDEPADDQEHNNSHQNNNNRPPTSTSPPDATQNSPPTSPAPSLRPSLNPLYQRLQRQQRAHNNNNNSNHHHHHHHQPPPAAAQTQRHSPNLTTPPAYLAKRADLTQPITLAHLTPSPASYLNSAPMPNYINFKKPQNEIFKKLDGKIQKIVAAHSNLNKLYALTDFPGLVGTGTAGVKRQPFELPAQLPRPPPWVPKCSTPDDPKHSLDDSRTPAYCSSTSGASSPSSKEDLIGQQQVLRKPNNSLSTSNYKSHMVKKFLADPEIAKQSSLGTGLGGSGTKASFILDAAISKLHQRHQEQKLKEQQQRRTIGATHVNSKLKPAAGSSTAHSISVTHIRDISSNSARRSSSSMSASSSSLLLNSNATLQYPQTDSPLSSADFNMLTEKIKETLDTQTFNIGKKTLRTPEEGRKYQEAIMSQFEEQLYSLTKSIRFKPPLTSGITTPSTTPANLKEHKSILMKKSPQSLFKTIQRETSLLLNRRQSQQNVRSSLSLLSDQQTNNRQNAHVKQAILAKTPPVYKPNSMRVIVPPSKAHYSLRFNNYLDTETPQPTAESMTIEEFAKGLNLVRTNDASLQRHQEQLLRSNSNWVNSSSTRPLRLRRIRGEKMRMPVSASYKAARKIGLQ